MEIAPVDAVLLALFLAAVGVITPTAAVCPRRCSCNDSAFMANCSSAGLNSFPILLHPRLRHLLLSTNAISRLQAGAVASYRRLLLLDLSANQLQQLLPDTFADLQQLQQLQLSRNRLQQLPPGCFNGLQQLLVLDLSDNLLEQLPGDLLSSLQQLQQLLVAGNRLQQLPVWPPAASVRSLDLSHNWFTQVPLEALASLTGLHALSVAHNRLSGHLATDHTWPPTLLSLDLSGNSVWLSARSLSGVAQLRRLRLQRVALPHVPDQLLQPLHQLQQLHFSHNQFDQLSRHVLSAQQQLQLVSITYCANLTSLDGALFAHTPALHTVIIEHNPQLVALGPLAFAPLDQLRHLSLRANGLATLAASAASWHQLQTLQLDGNPWLCDCQLQWLVEAAVAAGEAVATGTAGERWRDGGAVCSAPQLLRGRWVDSLAGEQLPCQRAWLSAVVMATAVCSALLVVAAAVGCTCYRFRGRLRALLKADNWHGRVQGKRKHDSAYMTHDTYMTHPRTYYYHDVCDVLDRRDRRLVPITEL